MRTLLGFAAFALAVSYDCGLLLSQSAGDKAALDTIAAVETRELHNVWRLSNRVLSGSEPESPAAFAELVRLGVKTIVSVDGMKPRLDLAKKLGMRYVHIPIGYDGIPSTSALSLARVARDTTDTIYIHCHHGKHRGPAAAAILCRVEDGRSPELARQILEKAGTGKEYPGLWRDVQKFQVPGRNVSLPELVESAQVESLAATMAKIDRSFDGLKQIATAGWRPSLEHPEISPSLQCIQLYEMFVEASRTHSQSELGSLLKSSAESIRELSEKLKTVELPAKKSDEKGRMAATELLVMVGQQCVQCHKQHRN